MRRYLVVAHRTLGGAHLFEHLHQLRVQDPFCQFHLLVPRYYPPGLSWTEGQANAAAQARLDEMLDLMAASGMGATGEVGDTNPVYAIGDTLRREGTGNFSGIVLSTLPRGISRWWKFDVPRRVAQHFPMLPLTHLVAAESLV
jgi:hypothetical protein